MTVKKFCAGLALAVAVSTLVGCGAEANTAIVPTDEFLEMQRKAEAEEASGGALPQ